MPPVIAAMVKEAKELETDISPAVESWDDTLWKPAAKKLSLLPLNRSFRESFPELLYRLVLLDRARGVQLLQNMYSWTNSLSSGGGLVSGGYFAAGGANVDRRGPGNAPSSTGLFLSAEKF